MGNASSEKKAVFAGGCFWCMQPVFDQKSGVVSTAVGYTGGKKENPTYEEVSTGKTGHIEAIEVTYDPSKVTYADLIETYWRTIDPTDQGGQFSDRGTQYKTAIFYRDEEEKRIALESKEKLAKSGMFKRPIATEIIEASPFYPAEGYHQKYYLKNFDHYERYKVGSGRAGFITRMWGKEKEVGK